MIVEDPVFTREDPVRGGSPGEKRFSSIELWPLLSSLRADLTSWFQQEGRIVQAEISEKTEEAKRGLFFSLIAGALFFFALITVFTALALGISGLLHMAGVPDFFSLAGGFLLSGLVGGIAGWVTLRRACNLLSPSNLSPERTAETLREARMWAVTKLTQYTDHE